MSKEKKSKLSTKLIHNGDGQFQKKLIKTNTVPETFPIYYTSVFAFDNTKDVDDIYDKKKDGYIYSRIKAPNSDAVSEIIASIENADKALVFASGMSAITSSILPLVKNGDHIIASNVLYGAVFNFFKNELPRFGIEVTFIDIYKESIDKYVKPNTKLVYTETISNPLVEVVDIEKIAKETHKHNLLFIVDNTFATSVLVRPIELGADIVLYSATKYLSGHSDIVAGALATNNKLIEKFRNAQIMYGGISSPFDSWLLARSLRTLELRILKHSQNALSIAQFLDNHPKISKVYYSGLKSSPFYKTALKQFQGKGFGGMMSFNIKGADGKAENLIKNVKNIPFAPSLAGTATTLSHSAKASHRPYSKQEREALGITENQLRLSVGLEDADDIIQYLSEGLKQI